MDNEQSASNDRVIVHPHLMKVFYALLAIATVIGGWAMIRAFSGGHGELNTTQHVPWGLWVAAYIFFLGLSAGAFLISSLVYVFGIKRLEAVGPLALFQALQTVNQGGVNGQFFDVFWRTEFTRWCKAYSLLLHINTASIHHHVLFLHGGDNALVRDTELA